MAERETEDPLKALASKDIHSRAAGARDLSKWGTPESVPLLVKMAREDRSPAVRLCTAGAAADILSRYRVGEGAELLDEEARTELFGLFKGIDPGINAGLFSMLAVIGLPRAVERIAAGLRDPRGGVRVGAGVGLQRLCASLAHHDDAELEARIVALLDDSRLPPDALAEVAKVCAAVGFQSARARLSSLVLPGAQGDLVNASLEVYDSLEAPVTGAWASDGLDVGEVNPDTSPATMVIGEQGDLVYQLESSPWQSRAGLSGERRMCVRRVGEAKAARALQWHGRTWYKADHEEVLAAVFRVSPLDSRDWAASSPRSQPAVRAAALVKTGLPETAEGKLAEACLLADAAEGEAALGALETAVLLKKAPALAWLALGDARKAAGDDTGAAAAWQECIKRAKNKKLPESVAAAERLARGPGEG